MHTLKRTLCFSLLSLALVACNKNQTINLPVDSVSLEGEMQLTGMDGKKVATSFELNDDNARSINDMTVTGGDKDSAVFSFSPAPGASRVNFSLSGYTRAQALGDLMAGQALSVDEKSTGQNAEVEVSVTASNAIDHQYSSQESCQIPYGDCYSESVQLAQPMDADDHDGRGGGGRGGGFYPYDPFFPYGPGGYGPYGPNCEGYSFPGTELNTYEAKGISYQLLIKIEQEKATAEIQSHYDNVTTKLVQSSGCHRAN